MAEAFATWIVNNHIELSGAVLGILYIFFSIRQHILTWPVGLATSILYIIVFYRSGFYADMGLQFYYVFISIYGWYHWIKGNGKNEKEERQLNDSVQEQETGNGKSEKEGRQLNDSIQEQGTGNGKSEKEGLPVTKMPAGIMIKTTVATFLIFLLLLFILKRFTDSTVPYMDSFTTALSITATWMLARKYIEHWLIWIIVDTVSAGLYVYKGLWPTVILFIVYTIMAIIGYIEWKKDYNNETATT
jgi:nicotinamide mononucleotide transporter